MGFLVTDYGFGRGLGGVYPEKAKVKNQKIELNATEIIKKLN